MNIGVDLDNTIVCYDGLFHRVALERGWIPNDLANDKQSVRDYLRGADRNDDWTILQGVIYGEQMFHAKPFSGAMDFFSAANERGWRVSIVSHRTRKPYLGPDTDLHEAAQQWLSENGFLEPGTRVFLEESLDQKLARIGRLQCDVFVDDLPELLTHEDFPNSTLAICFDPQQRVSSEVEQVASWQELADRLFEEDGS